MNSEVYLDVLTETGEMTGTSKSRTLIHQEGLWHRCVHVWIINNQGKVILQRRSSLKKSYPNRWDISAAGHVTAGDNSIETASKELSEELGLFLLVFECCCC
mgnify:CR=1 FL=1